VGFMIPAAILHPMADRRTHRWDFWAAGARQAAQAAYPFLDRAINRSGDDNGPIEGLKTDFGGLVQALRTSSSGKLFRKLCAMAPKEFGRVSLQHNGMLTRTSSGRCWSFPHGST
jgi:hypothetical protein